MMKVTYNKQLTALLVIDPYDDFISDGGKLWDRVRDETYPPEKAAEAYARMLSGKASNSASF